MTRFEQIEKKASEYQGEIFRINPNGFHVAPFCNEESLAEAFSVGAEWADKNPNIDTLRMMFPLSLGNAEKMLAIAEQALKSIERNSCCNLCECSACVAKETLVKIQELKK